MKGRRQPKTVHSQATYIIMLIYNLNATFSIGPDEESLKALQARSSDLGLSASAKHRGLSTTIPSSLSGGYGGCHPPLIK